jgi:hypothetical protein
MPDQEHEIEAFDDEEAQQWAQAHTPEAHFYKVTYLGGRQSKNVEGWGDTVEQAVTQARKAISKDVQVDYENSAGAWQETYPVLARSERAAEVEVKRQLIHKYIKLLNSLTWETTFGWDAPFPIGTGAGSTIANRFSEAHPEFLEAKAKLELRLVQQHTKIIEIKLDGPRSFLGPLVHSRYNVTVLHHAKSVITCHTKAKYSVLVTDDSCKTGVHAWGAWEPDGSETSAGYKIDDVPVYIEGGHRTCSHCQLEEKCRHEFGDWQANLHKTGSFRKCKICGAPESFDYSSASY